MQAFCEQLNSVIHASDFLSSFSTWQDLYSFFKNLNVFLILCGSEVSDQEALEVYSMVGGIPLYLTLFDDNRTVKENVIKNCLSTTGYLFGEVETLLRMELKKTYFYKNIMLAINAGASNLNKITDKVGDESAKVAKYINVLVNLKRYFVVTAGDLF